MIYSLSCCFILGNDHELPVWFTDCIHRCFVSTENSTCLCFLPKEYFVMPVSLCIMLLVNWWATFIKKVKIDKINVKLWMGSHTNCKFNICLKTPKFWGGLPEFLLRINWSVKQAKKEGMCHFVIGHPLLYYYTYSSIPFSRLPAPSPYWLIDASMPIPFPCSCLVPPYSFAPCFPFPFPWFKELNCGCGRHRGNMCIVVVLAETACKGWMERIAADASLNFSKNSL